MTEDGKVTEEAPPEDVTAEAEAEAPETPEVPEYDPEVAAEAKRYGWRDPADWKGEPPERGFMGPDEYLETPGILRRRLIDTEKRLAETDRKYDTRLTTMERMHQEADKRRREMHQAEVERVRQEMREAAQEGDMPRYDRLAKKTEMLEGAAPGETPAQAGQDVNAEAAREVEDAQNWVQSLPQDHWYHRDRYLKGAVGAAYEEAASMGITGFAEKLRFAENKAREMMPDRFTNGAAPAKTTVTQMRPRSAPVDGGGLGGGAPRSMVAKVPKEFHAQMKADIAEGLFKNEQDWAKSYFKLYGEAG